MELGIFRTSTLTIAAFILANGIDLLRCESVGRNRVEFLFRDPEGQIGKLANNYYAGAPCSALRFYNAILELRRTIDQTLGGAR